MKVLLIQVPWTLPAAGDFRYVAKRFASYPPCGLMSLAAFLEKKGHSVRVFDLEAEYRSPQALVAEIGRSKTDLIGFTATTPFFHVVRAYAQEIRRCFKTPIVVGGPHVSAVKAEALTSEFDFAVMGEGEHTLLELIHALEGNGTLSEIRGLIYRNGNTTTVASPRDFIQDLDALPFPDRTKIAGHKYVIEVPARGTIPVATIELTRGCPFRCVFCAEPLNSGRKIRARSPERVVAEMLKIRKEEGIGHFFMLDSTLTVDRKLIESFCLELIARNASVTFEGQTRANLVDEPLLCLMKSAGLVRLSFGLESSNARVLELMKKDVPLVAMKHAFQLCQKLKISACCGAMIGNPGDTRETVLETARFIRSIPEIRYAPISIAIPYPGTELLSMAQHQLHGLKLIESDFKKYFRYTGGVMEVNGMGPRELLKLQRQALFLSHSTPSKIFGIIRHFGLLSLVGLTLKMLLEELTSFFKVPKLGVGQPLRDNTTFRNLKGT